MKKVRIFLTAAALLLVTAGVFAGKAKFAGGTATNLYYLSSGTYVPMATAITTTTLEYSTTAFGTQAKFNPAGTDFLVYYTPNGTNYYEVYYQ